MWIIKPSQILSNVLSGVTFWISDWFWSHLTWLMKWIWKLFSWFSNFFIDYKNMQYNNCWSTGNLTNFCVTHRELEQSSQVVLLSDTISICWKGVSKVASFILTRQKPTMKWQCRRNVFLHGQSSFVQQKFIMTLNVIALELAGKSSSGGPGQFEMFDNLWY